MVQMLGFLDYWPSVPPAKSCWSKWLIPADGYNEINILFKVGISYSPRAGTIPAVRSYPLDWVASQPSVSSLAGFSYLSTSSPVLWLASIRAWPGWMPVEWSFGIIPDNSCSFWYWYRASALRNRLLCCLRPGPELGAQPLLSKVFCIFLIFSGASYEAFRFSHPDLEMSPPNGPHIRCLGVDAGLLLSDPLIYKVSIECQAVVEALGPGHVLADSRSHCISMKVWQ